MFSIQPMACGYHVEQNRSYRIPDIYYSLNKKSVNIKGNRKGRKKERKQHKWSGNRNIC